MITERYLPIWGGAENQLQQLIPHLGQSGATIYVLTRRWEQDWSKREYQQNSEIIRLGVPGSGRIATILFLLHVVVFCFMQRNSFDLFHSHGAVKMGALIAMLALILKKKSVAKIATAGHVNRLQKHAWGRLIVWAFKKCDAVIAMTDEINEELLGINVKCDKIVRITNGVNCERFRTVEVEERGMLRKKLGLPETDVLFIFSGRIVKRKGLDFIIEMWPSILKHSPNVSLLLLGSGAMQPDSIEDTLRAEIQRNNIPKVHFLGETAVPEEFLQASDIFVFPSRKEGFPNAVMEAMATGLPTLSSDIGGVAELVTDGVTGMKFKLDDKPEFLDRCLLLLNSLSLRDEIGKNARDLMLRKYSFQSIAKEYLKLYERLLLSKTMHLAR